MKNLFQKKLSKCYALCKRATKRKRAADLNVRLTSEFVRRAAKRYPQFKFYLLVLVSGIVTFYRGIYNNWGRRLDGRFYTRKERPRYS